MAVVILENKITNEEFDLAKQEYKEYIKIVVDIDKNILAAGGEWHADAESVLLNYGSKQSNLWGGGIDLVSGNVDYISLINTRPGFNNSQEVTDIEIRSKMFNIIKDIFKSYVKTG